MKDDPEDLPRSYFTPQNYHSAKWWATGKNIAVYPNVNTKTVLDIVGVYGRGGMSQLVYFDIQETKYPWSDEKEFIAQRAVLQAAEFMIREQYEVLDVKDIVIHGKPTARRYLIRKY